MPTLNASSKGGLDDFKVPKVPETASANEKQKNAKKHKKKKKDAIIAKEKQTIHNNENFALAMGAHKQEEEEKEESSNQPEDQEPIIFARSQTTQRTPPRRIDEYYKSTKHLRLTGPGLMMTPTMASSTSSSWSVNKLMKEGEQKQQHEEEEEEEEKFCTPCNYTNAKKGKREKPLGFSDIKEEGDDEVVVVGNGGEPAVANGSGSSSVYHTPAACFFAAPGDIIIGLSHVNIKEKETRPEGLSYKGEEGFVKQSGHGKVFSASSSGVHHLKSNVGIGRGRSSLPTPFRTRDLIPRTPLYGPSPNLSGSRHSSCDDTAAAAFAKRRMDFTALNSINGDRIEVKEVLEDKGADVALSDNDSGAHCVSDEGGDDISLATNLSEQLEPPKVGKLADGWTTSESSTAVNSSSSSPSTKRTPVVPTSSDGLDKSHVPLQKSSSTSPPVQKKNGPRVVKTIDVSPAAKILVGANSENKVSNLHELSRTSSSSGTDGVDDDMLSVIEQSDAETEGDEETEGPEEMDVNTRIGTKLGLGGDEPSFDITLQHSDNLVAIRSSDPQVANLADEDEVAEINIVGHADDSNPETLQKRESKFRFFGKKCLCTII
eukprot:Nk52_evm12s212 gene=Nk52_evmTU12s212